MKKILKIDRKTKILLALLVVLALEMILMQGCSRDLQNFEQTYQTYNGSGVYRYVDEEAGVACWVYELSGISCLPISDTLLGTP